MDREIYQDIAIGIVLYNPNIELLKENITRLKAITNSIIFIENGSNNKDEIIKTVNHEYKIIFNEKNLGIAKALNQLLNEAINENKEYLLTLDQDSRMTRYIFDNLYKYRNVENVAIVCPTIYDINKKKNKKKKKKYEYVNRCITSGSLMNLSICSKLEKFDEKMFIDYVDFDYCKNVTLAGYKIIKVRDAILPHEIGKRLTKKILFFYVYPTNHSSFRVFYYIRNIKYYYWKYKKKMTIKEKIKEKINIVWKFISIILYEENKKEKLLKAREGYKNYKEIINKGERK